MARVEMTVAKALTTRKNMKKKIERKIANFNSVGVRTNKNDGFVNGVPYKEWESEIKSEYQSIQTLSLNYDILNAAILQSNATTMVKAYGREMTVSELVSFQSSDMNNVMKMLADKMKADYDSAADRYNKLSKDNLSENNVSKAIAFIKCSSKESEKAIREKVVDINTPIIDDPLKAERESREYAAEEYANSVEEILQTSNCNTKIVVNYID